MANMDEWQLSHLALSMVLPLRPEDFAGLLVGDVDFEKQHLAFGSRFAGRDFNKGHVSFVSPFPAALIPFLRFVIGGRTDCPLLRARTILKAVPAWSCGCCRPRHHLAHRRCIPAGVGGDSKTLQDQQRPVCGTIREMGGVLDGELAEEFRSVLRKAELEKPGRFYDLRVRSTRKWSGQAYRTSCSGTSPAIPPVTSSSRCEPRAPQGNAKIFRDNRAAADCHASPGTTTWPETADIEFGGCPLPMS